MANKFVHFLESVGRDFAKGLGFAVKDAPELSLLAGLLYPPAIAIAPAVTTALNLVQNTILAVEQKYAAAGVQNSTGAQKSADVLAIVAPAVVSLLTSAGVPNVDTDHVAAITNAVVGILNARPAPTA